MGDPCVQSVTARPVAVREEASMAMDSVPYSRTVRLRSAVFVFASLIVVNMIAALVVLRTLGIAG